MPNETFLRAKLERAVWFLGEQVFDGWLEKEYRAPDAATIAIEREQRSMLARSAANAHARRNCSSDAEFARLAKADRAAAIDAVRAVAAAGGRARVKFGATAFVSMFGGPGEHGYGSHSCRQAAKTGLPLYRSSAASLDRLL